MSDINARIAAAERRWEKTDQRRTECKDALCLYRSGQKPDWRQLDETARIVRRLERLGDHEAAASVMNSDTPDFDPLERVLNANQMTGVAFFEKGLIAARSVARVQIRGMDGALQGHGSGVLISPRLFMTNNHVLSSPAEAAASIAQFGYLVGADGVPRDPESFALDPATFFETDEDLDVTIVAIHPVSNTGSTLGGRGWCPLIPGSGKALVSERVNIIQHPGGERMQIAVRENTIVAVVDDFLQYETDTRPGSSGSPVFNDQWEMAALHHAGVPARDAQGRILMDGDVPWTGRREDIHRIKWVANEGVRISRIVAHVNAQSLSPAQAALWQEAFTAPPAISLWDQLQSPTPASPTQPGPEAATPSDGQASWLFRLSFGPVGDGAIPATPPALSATPVTPQPPRSPMIPAAPQSVAPPAPADDPRALAQQLIEQFAHTGPYYDAVADQAAATAYWQGVDWEKPASDLFTQLTIHLGQTHTTQMSYRRARHQFLYPAIDLHPDGKLHNIYSGVPFDPTEALAGEVDLALSAAEVLGVETSNILSLLEEDAFWDDLEERSALPFNCEHVVPQSCFGKRQPMKADIHHLFACEPGCNSFRSNIPYWQFDPTDEVERDLCGRREGNKFEPEHGKGAAARATFYFLMRYPGEVGDKRTELTKSRLPHLLRWHEQYPVSEYERHRNWLTEKAQGNRNPFIDRPEIATRALLTLGFMTS